MNSRIASSASSVQPTGLDVGVTKVTQPRNTPSASEDTMQLVVGAAPEEQLQDKRLQYKAAHFLTMTARSQRSNAFNGQPPPLVDTRKVEAAVKIKVIIMNTDSFQG